MKESEYIAQIESLWPKEGEAPLSTLSFAASGIEVYPSSYRLRIYLGCLIQLGPVDSPYSIDDARDSYLRAVEIDPENPEAYEELGHFFEAVEDDEVIAEQYFAKAKELKQKTEQVDSPKGLSASG